MHLNEEQIQRFLHGELDPRSKEALSQHVAACADCARQLADAEGEEIAIFDLLASVDHPAPRVQVASLTRESRVLAVWGRRAAGFLVAAALAGAAYAIPGSPLPAMVKAVAEWIGGTDSSSPPPVGDSPAATGPITSGIAVPVSERFTIAFISDQAEGVISVSLTEQPNLVVRVLGGTATFTTDVDRLTIDNRGSTAYYEFEVPRRAPFVEVTIGTRRIVLKDGDALAAGLATDDRGRGIVSLATPEN